MGLSVDETSLDYFRRVDGVKVWADTQLDDNEIKAYIARKRSESDNPLSSLLLHVDGDEIEILARYDIQPFERIRRITGYLVGTLERFNDGKRAEESERVKHTI